MDKEHGLRGDTQMFFSHPSVAAAPKLEASTTMFDSILLAVLLLVRCVRIAFGGLLNAKLEMGVFVRVSEIASGVA